MLILNTPASILALIDKIAATSSKLEKESLIREGGSHAMFMKVVRAAYDPFINYGIRIIPERAAGAAPGANSLSEDTWWTMLSDLAARRLTGDNARNAVQRAVNFLDEPSRELFIRIIRKDLRAGFSEGTINRVFPKTFAEFPYMRCTLPEKSNMASWDWSVGIISQEKADGMFTNVNVDDKGNVWLTSRQGSPIPLDNLGLYDAIQDTLTWGTQSHGELTVYKDGLVLPREIGNGMLNSVLNGGTLDEGCTARLDLWDQIPLAEVKPKGKYATAYKERLSGLLLQLRRIEQDLPQHKGLLALVPTRVVKSKAQAYEHYRELLKLGKEGTVVKHPNMDWKDSSGGNKDQVKLKLEADMELRIVEVLPGTVGTKNEGRAGSVLCETECGALRVNVTIKNEKMRDAVDADWAAWQSKIMTVRANSIMTPSESNEFHSLFLPRFVEDVARFDKSVADDLETVKQIFRNAVEAA